MSGSGRRHRVAVVIKGEPAPGGDAELESAVEHGCPTVTVDGE
jgi:hypothetical protein